MKRTSKSPIGAIVLFVTIVFCAPAFSANIVPVSLPGSCKVLDPRGGEITTKDFDPSHLQHFVNILRRVTSPTVSVEQFKSFSANRRLTVARAEEMFLEMINPASAIFQEIIQFITRIGGAKDNPAFWDAYFPSYDKITSFADGYRNILQFADQVLPTTGRIADLGGGSGNGATLLSAESGRQVVLADFSEKGLALAQKKIDAGGKRTHPIELIQGDLQERLVPANSLDGALMNNVLYAVNQPKVVLKQVHDALKPGGIFVLNDPNNATANVNALRRFGMGIILDAIKNRAPVTEYDWAIVGVMNAAVLLKTKFNSREQLEALVKESGFELLGAYTAYYGATTMLVLRKP